MVSSAADGTIWAWTGRSGTLILQHGDGFYTMYTHVSNRPVNRAACGATPSPY